MHKASRIVSLKESWLIGVVNSFLYSYITLIIIAQKATKIFVSLHLM